MSRSLISSAVALTVVVLAIAVLAWAPSAAFAAEAKSEPAETGSSDSCDAAGLLRPTCELAQGGLPGPGALLTGALTSGADSVIRGVVDWVVGGASWLLGELMQLIDSSTRPNLRRGWFSGAYRDMTTVAMLLMLPLLLLSVIHALVRQSVEQVVRVVIVYVPAAAIGTFLALTVVDQLLVITDDVAAWTAQSFGADMDSFAANVTDGLADSTRNATGVALPGFAALLGALVIAFASFVIWVLLVLRQAAIYVAVLFLPLGFAALVWPATAHWLRRLVEGLVALILAKFVIVAVMSLGGSALASIATEGFGAVVSGGSMLLLAAFAPFVLLRFIPVFDTGVTSQLDGVTTQRTSPVTGPSARGIYAGVQRARMASGARTATAANLSPASIPVALGSGGAGAVTAGLVAGRGRPQITSPNAAALSLAASSAGPSGGGRAHGDVSDAAPKAARAASSGSAPPAVLPPGTRLPLPPPHESIPHPAGPNSTPTRPSRKGGEA